MSIYQIGPVAGLDITHLHQQAKPKFAVTIAPKKIEPTASQVEDELVTGSSLAAVHVWNADEVGDAIADTELVKGYDNDIRKILIPMIRRILPSVIANEIMGVQPMSEASGLIFSKPANDFEKISDDRYKYWKPGNSIVTLRMLDDGTADEKIAEFQKAFDAIKERDAKDERWKNRVVNPDMEPNKNVKLEDVKDLLTPGVSSILPAHELPPFDELLKRIKELKHEFEKECADKIIDQRLKIIFAEK